MVIGIGFLLNDLDRANIKVHNLENEKSKLVSKIEENDKIRSEYKEKISKLNIEVKTLDNSNKAEKEKVDKLESNVNRLKNENEVLVNNVKELKKKDDSLTMKLTYYTPNCKGCSGITKSGVNVKSTIYHDGMRIVASDSSIIPLGSIIEISDGVNTFKAQVHDIGGGINGHELDVLVSTTSEANSLGVRYAKVKILRKGW